MSTSLRGALMALAVGAVATLSAASAQAATLIWDLSSPAGVLPLAGQSYTAGGITISAAEFLNGNFSSPNLQLFGKTGGGDENRLTIRMTPIRRVVSHQPSTTLQTLPHTQPPQLRNVPTG